MGKLSKIAGTVLGTTTLAALPVATDAAVISENEGVTPNNTFPGQNIGAGDTFHGANNGTTDPIDFLHYAGLSVGGVFDFTVQRDPCCLANPFLLDAALYSDQTTTVNPPVPIDLLQGETKHLQGLVPGSGQLTLGVKLLSSGTGVSFFESYTVSLAVTPPSRVTQPATIALLLAGLTGLQILRRRKPR
jgi:hypothetical protein